MISSLVLSMLAAQSGSPVLIDTFVGSREGSQFGSTTLDMGDLNGDGVADLAIASPEHAFPELLTYATGRVDVISGASNLPLYRVDVNPNSFDTAGTTLLNMGDLDGDGINDLWIGAAGRPIAFTVSGADGSLLYRIVAEHFRFATSFDTIDDLNNDGKPEVVVGFWSDSVTLPSSELLFQTGRVQIFDGADGSVMIDVHGHHSFQGFGGRVLNAGDLDGDGVSDIIIIDQGFGLGNFAIRAFSGADGHSLYIVRDQRVNTLSQISIDQLDDFNADGVPDLLLSAHTFENAAGHATGFTAILSGSDGSSLHEIFGPGYPWPGRNAANVGDVSGDGIRDFAVGEPLSVNGVEHLGVKLYSGADASLLAVIDSGQSSWTGHSLSGCSDRDGDGVGELVLGIPQSTRNGVPWESLGEVLIYALH